MGNKKTFTVRKSTAKVSLQNISVLGTVRNFFVMTNCAAAFTAYYSLSLVSILWKTNKKSRKIYQSDLFSSFSDSVEKSFKTKSSFSIGTKSSS